MIANNDNTGPRFDVVLYRQGESADDAFMDRIENAAGLTGSADGVMAANAGRGAVNHYLEDSPYLAGIQPRPQYVEPLICPCNSELYPCLECRAEMDELARLRRLREADTGATDGEPRDYPEDVT